MMNLDKYKQIFREFAEEVEFMDDNIKKLNLDKNSRIKQLKLIFLK